MNKNSIKWNDERILSTLKLIIHDLKLDRMPKINEIADHIEGIGLYKAMHRNGGMSKFSKILNLNYSQIYNREDFIRVINEVNENVMLLGDYKTSKTKTLFRCKICGHEWETTPDGFIRKTKDCRKCKINRLKLKITKTHADFIAELNNVNASIVCLEKYINAKTPILFKCSIDNHEWYSTPNNILRFHGCPKCTHYIKPTNDEFIDRVYNTHGNTVICLETYIDSVTKLKFECLLGHTWYSTPTNITNGNSCPVCNTSKGEKRVLEVLNTYGINNEPQKSFIDLLGLKGKPLIYDFYLLDYDILLEYQGIQHYEPIDFQGEGYEIAVAKYEIQKEHDKRKYIYANKGRYSLIEIPYWDYDIIENIIVDEIKKIEEWKYYYGN